MTTPAWGTPPAEAPADEFAVTGFYAANGQRFFAHVTAGSARQAEDVAMRKYGQQLGADGEPCDLWICGVAQVVAGRVQPVDTYATRLDPDRKPEVG